MPGMSDYSAENWLAYIVGKTSMPATPTAYVALLTAAFTSDAGTGGTEVTGGAYARVATSGGTWNAASGSSGTEPATTPAGISNAGTISFTTATANWGTVVAFALYDASGSGNLLAWDYLGNYAWQPATIASGSPATFTLPNHGFSNGTSVVVTDKYGGTLPTATQGSFAGTLTVENVTTNTFSLQTSGATAINTTTLGECQVRQISTQSIQSGVQASFTGGSPGQLVLTAA